MHRRRTLAGLVPILLATTSLALVGGSSTGGSAAVAAAPASSQVVLDWERSLFRTVYTERATPIPVGVLYLGFTSMAMHRAVTRAQHQDGSPVAAAAVAAHDVLEEYFPLSGTNLDADLTTSLAAVPDGPAETRGAAIGAAVAARLVERRADDGRDDPTIVYDRDEAPGVWQAIDPAGNPMTPPFVAPWLGFVDPLVLHARVRVDGPDRLTSKAYAADVREVKRVGRATDADRTAYQTETANFFNSNSATMVGEALLDVLESDPMSLRATSRLFARIHAAMADSIIRAWRLKFDVGFWRPYHAIQHADTDGNPATVADPAWTPLVANPAYPDYVSGHGSLTAPAAEVIRRTLGEETALTLHSYTLGTDRTYETLGELEFDAFHARIWGGLHFRDAMDDAYRLGHETARRVMRRVD